MCNLADMYNNGTGVKRDVNKAVELFNQAIKFEVSEAMNQLANVYNAGKGVKKDYAKAIELYNQAIKLNDAYAMHNLATMYAEGKGIRQDYKKAMELYINAYKTDKEVNVLEGISYVLFKDSTQVNELIKDETLYDLILQNKKLKTSVNNILFSTSKANIDELLKINKILNKKNLDVLNKHIKDYSLKQGYMHDTKITTLEECYICYEKQKNIAVYDCKCKSIKICAECLTKIKACPMCRYDWL
jgi:tetratricopeptide (TPR) repeat protein